MTLEEWEATYLPKINHLNKVDDLGDTTTLFETYGIELGYVLATADLEPNRVWTLVDGDDGTYIVNGYHLVNRVAYMITNIPFEGEFLEVLDTLYSEDEKEQSYEQRVQALEDEGLTRSDAQGVVDAEILKEAT